LAKGIEKGIQVPEEIQPGVLMKGMVHSVYGQSGSGKTMFMLDLVKGCLARGQTSSGHDRFGNSAC
jgi:RecA/RadA recombinase